MPCAAAEPVARLVLRSEAVASSRIEGLSISPLKLLEREALDELGVNQRLDSTSAAVLANINAMQDAVDYIAGRQRITVQDICRINRGVLAGSSLEEYGGVIRESQNWVGGSATSPVGGSSAVSAEARQQTYCSRSFRGRR